MDSFSEWVNTADHPCFQEWGSLAVELGASWDSFRRVDKDVIVQDLVKGGIPILAARDMTVIASKEIQRNQAPMAIFWDLENMPIPTEASGRDIVTSLKSILAPLGDLIQFRGYASIGLNHIPQEKRSDLQLSGCHLVDCPHHGRKEVADKMIIVDAMQFAFQHPDAATLCLITGDSDYAYLLATLQRPQWRTIVISRGTMQSMLHVNCDMKMRWETDILQPIYSGVNGTPETEEEISTEPTGRWASLFRPLSADEGWKDDVELLRTVIKQQGQNHGTLAPLKSLVGNILRNTNPARFPQRINIQDFLARAIAEGVVVEKGEKQYKTLCLPMHANHSSTSPLMPLAKMLPAKFEQFPLKVVDMARATPFIILLRKAHCPPGETPPSKAYVQSSSEWLFYMFASYRIALEAVASHRWLCQGTLVDIRQIEEIPIATAVRSSSREGNVSCSVCSAVIADSFATEDASGRFYCSVECQEFTKYSPARVKKGIELLIETLEFLEGYDDLYVPHGILTKMLPERHGAAFPSRGIAKATVLEANKAGSIAFYKFRKNKFVALPKYFPPGEQSSEDFATDNEVQYVHRILWDEMSGACVDRKDINRRLAEKFPSSMATPHQRKQVYANGSMKKLFFLSKGPRNQMVGLTYEDAEAALDRGIATGSDGPQQNETQDRNNSSSDDSEDASSDESEDGVDISALIRRNVKM